MNNFNNLEIKRIRTSDAEADSGKGYASSDDLNMFTATEYADGDANNYIHESELECVEAYASDNNLIDDERNLSIRFDEMMQECTSVEYLQSIQDDAPALSEHFSNYTDSLQSDGDLHHLQVNEYCYVGDEFPALRG